MEVTVGSNQKVSVGAVKVSVGVIVTVSVFVNGMSGMEVVVRFAVDAGVVEIMIGVVVMVNVMVERGGVMVIVDVTVDSDEIVVISVE